MNFHLLKEKSILLVLFLLIWSIPSLAFADAEKIFRENSKAVVVVVTFDDQGEPLSQGSGFIVRSDGAVVTNYHVISNAQDIQIKAGDKILDVEGIIYKDKENDLVMLKVKGGNLPIVKLGDIEKEIVGEKIYVISSPQGLENTISDGLLSGIREITDKKKVLQITAPISSGSSGSPVFNKKGEVIGIATFLLKESQNLNFAMPINLIKNKLNITKHTKLINSATENYRKTAEYWFAMSFAYGQSGEYQKSADASKQAIRIKPDHIDAHLNLGISYINLGKYQEAIDSFKQLIKIKPDTFEAYTGLGIAYFLSDKWKESEDAFNQALSIKSDHAKAHAGLGLLYRLLGKYQEAIDSFKQAIRIDPDYEDFHYQLGYSYVKLGKYQEAVDACKQSIRINPDNADAHYELARAYHGLGKLNEAVNTYIQTIRIKPNYAMAHYNLGIAYGKLGKLNEAVDANKQAIRIDPDNVNAHYNLGVVYGQLNKWKEAIDPFKQAIRIDPDYAAAHYNFGITSLMINDKGSSLEAYNILKDLDKESANKLFNFIYP